MKVDEWLNTKLGQDIWNNKYKYNNENFEEWLNRISNGNEELRQLITEEKFLFGGRTLSNYNTNKQCASTSNCYSSGYAPDSLEGLLELNKNIGLTYKVQGGQGISLSKIRPKGSTLSNGYETDGIVSFMTIFNTTTASVSQGGSRKGALMMSLDAWHKEADTFIKIKSQTGSIEKANLSLEIDDEFMQCVKEDFKTGKETIINRIFTYETGKIEYEVTPIKLYKDFCKISHEWAEPGLIYTKRFRNYNLMEFDNDYEIVTGNPSMPKDVLVGTTNGIFNINELENKDFFVTTLNGELAQAKCWLSSANSEVFDIDFGGKRHSYATSKHKFPILENNKIVRKAVSELRIGDLVPLNRNELQGYSNNLTEDEGFLAGVFLAEGSITKRKEYNSYVSTLSIGKKDEDIKDRIDKIFSELTNKEIKYLDRNGAFQASITDKHFIEDILINKLKLNLSCDGKTIPKTVWTSGDNFIKGFIDGLFSCDGNIKLVNNGRNVHAQIQLTTNMDSISEAVQKLLGFYGISSTLYSRDRKINFPNGKDYNKTYHSVELNMSPVQTVRFNNLFKLTCNRKQNLINKNLTCKAINGDHAYYLKIKSISLRSSEPVWDITVFNEQHVFPSQHCYTGNCGEQPLPKDGACNLGSINLSEFITNPYTEKAKFDFNSFNKAVEVSIKSLDEVIDYGYEFHALQSQRDMSYNYRNIGLGIMGLGSMFFKMKLIYGSKKSILLIDEIMGGMFRFAVFASNKLAKEKGTFPKYKDIIFDSEIMRIHFTKSEIDKLKFDGSRNCSLLSIAPSGSIATMLNITTGGESAFRISYKRKTESLHKNTDVYYDVYVREAEEYKKLFKTDILPKYFVSSESIKYEDRINMQSIIQNHVDTAISSTINLPNETTVEDVEKLYMLAWEKGLKGVTIYRDGCSRGGILTTNKKEKPSIKLERGDWKPKAGDTIYYERKLTIGCGKLKLFIGWSDSEKEIQDLYVIRSGKGGCEKNIQTSVIAMSGMLRLGGKLNNIERSFEGVGGCNSFVGQRSRGEKLSKGSSCGTAILNEIKLFQSEVKVLTPKTQKIEIEDTNLKTSEEILYLQENGEIDYAKHYNKCPTCGEVLRQEGGCATCGECGWSKCS